MSPTRYKLKPQKPTEFSHQQALFAWIDKIGCVKWPALKWTFAIPNYSGKVNWATHIWYQQQGKRPGVPDIFVPAPLLCMTNETTLKAFYAGLFIELKRDSKSKLRPEQVEYLSYLRHAGYATAVCCSAQEAIDTIEAYMRGDL